MKEALESTAAVVLETGAGAARRSRSFAAKVDFIFDSSLPLDLSAPVVFAGYGISEKAAGYDDLAAVDVKDKIVLILSDAPGKDDPASPLQKKEVKEKYFPAAPAMRRGGGDFAKAAELFKRGALAVLVVKNDLGRGGDIQWDILAQQQVRDDKPILPDSRKRLLIPGAKGMPWEGRAILRVSREMADAILEAAGETVAGLQKKIAAKYRPQLVRPARDQPAAEQPGALRAAQERQRRRLHRGQRPAAEEARRWSSAATSTTWGAGATTSSTAPRTTPRAPAA